MQLHNMIVNVATVRYWWHDESVLHHEYACMHAAGLHQQTLLSTWAHHYEHPGSFHTKDHHCEHPGNSHTTKKAASRIPFVRIPQSFLYRLTPQTLLLPRPITLLFAPLIISKEATAIAYIMDRIPRLLTCQSNGLTNAVMSGIRIGFIPRASIPIWMWIYMLQYAASYSGVYCSRYELD